MAGQVPPGRAATMLALLALGAVALAAGLGVAAWRAGDPQAVSGFFRTDQQFAGTADANETVVHPFTLVVPPQERGEGLTFTGDHAAASFKPVSADLDAYRMQLVDHHDTMLLDEVVDPADGNTWIHGPLFLDLGPGAYELRVSPPGAEPARYGIEMSLAFPVLAEVEGRVLPVAALWGLTGAASVLAALAVAVALWSPRAPGQKVFPAQDASEDDREA